MTVQILTHQRTTGNLLDKEHKITHFFYLAANFQLYGIGKCQPIWKGNSHNLFASIFCLITDVYGQYFISAAARSKFKNLSSINFAYTINMVVPKHIIDNNCCCVKMTSLKKMTTLLFKQVWNN